MNKVPVFKNYNIIINAYMDIVTGCKKGKAMKTQLLQWFISAPDNDLYLLSI